MTWLTGVGLALALGGCTGRGNVDRSDHIALDVAFESVATGLKKFAATLEAPPKLTPSLSVCKIQLVLNISANALGGGRGGVTLAPPYTAFNVYNASILSGEQDNTSSAPLANTITIELDGDRSRCPAPASLPATINQKLPTSNPPSAAE